MLSRAARSHRMMRDMRKPSPPRYTQAMSESPSTVVLLHRCPDGSAHFDWLLRLLPEQERALLSLRTTQRPDQLTPGQCISAELLPPHRTIYLTYEGPLTGNRGEVERVAEGRILEISDSALPPHTLTIHWPQSPSPVTYQLKPAGESDRTVEISRLPAPAQR